MAVFRALHFLLCRRIIIFRLVPLSGALLIIGSGRRYRTKNGSTAAEQREMLLSLGGHQKYYCYGIPSPL